MAPELLDVYIPPDKDIEAVMSSHPKEVPTAMPLELAIERTPELTEVPVAPISIRLPVAPAPVIVAAAFVAVKVPPEIVSPPAESSTPVAPEIVPVLG